MSGEMVSKLRDEGRHHDVSRASTPATFDFLPETALFHILSYFHHRNSEFKNSYEEWN